MIKQLSVLVSNNPGNLFNVVEILKENNIECYGLSTYDATDFGVFHMIVDDPDRCNDVLSSKGKIRNSSQTPGKIYKYV